METARVDILERESLLIRIQERSGITLQQEEDKSGGVYVPNNFSFVGFVYAIFHFPSCHVPY